MSDKTRPPDGGGNGGSKGGGHEGAVSYSDKVKVRVQNCERLKRNVLEINLDYDSGPRPKIEKDVLAKMLAKIGIDISNQMEGYQVINKKIYVWCKDNCDLERFCRDECFQVTDGVKTGLIKPMERRNVAVTIKNINFNTPDTLVMEYLGKFGNVTSNKVFYDTDKEGPFRGLRNGDRKYLVDFTNGRNMGTYHIIDGANVNVSYPGMQRTCGRCHQTSRVCAGGSWAKKCEENKGERVKLIDHMKTLWQEIGFKPSEFKLEEVEEDDRTADAEIKDTIFTPPQRRNKLSSDEKAKFTGVSIKNLPKDIPDQAIIAFLETKGLPMGWKKVKFIRNQKNTNVDIDGIEAVVCETLIENFHEQICFDMKTYCRGMSRVITPIKPSTDNNSPVTPQQPEHQQLASISPGKNCTTEKTNSPGSKIPGLSEKDFKKSQKNKKKKNKEITSSEKKKREQYKQKYFIKVGKSKHGMDEFIFSENEDGNESDSENSGKGFFRKSPLESVSLVDDEIPLLTPTAFKSRTAKTIQKQELWNLSVQQSGKRPLPSPEDQHRHMRKKSSSN